MVTRDVRFLCKVMRRDLKDFVFSSTRYAAFYATLPVLRKFLRRILRRNPSTIFFLRRVLRRNLSTVCLSTPHSTA